MDKTLEKIRTIALILALLLLPLFIYLEFKPEDIEEVEYGEEYYAGYEVGFSDAVTEVFKDVQFWVEDDLFQLENEIEDMYGLTAENAIHSLIGHTDGMELSKEELENAIWAMNHYYNGVAEVVNGISSDSP